MATQIISISQATTYALTVLERVKPHRITQVSHGFQLSYFEEKNDVNIERVRSTWAIPKEYPRIGVIARHIEWKGVQFIVSAFARLLADFPKATLILANADGPYRETIQKQLAALPSSRYVLIPFEKDLVSLYRIFDVYVHTPIDEISEAFGQTYVEALATGIPSIFTKSGVAAEFIEHQKNAWVVDFCDSNAIYEGMKELIGNEQLSQRLRTNGKSSVERYFEFEGMISKLRQVYEE